MIDLQVYLYVVDVDAHFLFPKYSIRLVAITYDLVQIDN